MKRTLPRLVCDVPGCGHARRPGDRLCLRCVTRLPEEISVGIVAAHDERRWLDHAALKRRAARFLNLDTTDCPSSLALPERRPLPTVSAQRAYENHARLLGERPDA
jgi:hypothetical protein